MSKREGRDEVALLMVCCRVVALSSSASCSASSAHQRRSVTSILLLFLFFFLLFFFFHPLLVSRALHRAIFQFGTAPRDIDWLGWHPFAVASSGSPATGHLPQQPVLCLRALPFDSEVWFGLWSRHETGLDWLDWRGSAQLH